MQHEFLSKRINELNGKYNDLQASREHSDEVNLEKYKAIDRDVSHINGTSWNHTRNTDENLPFNPVNLETVLLSEVVNPDENSFKESLADLDAKYFFPEMLPDYFQNNNKDLNINMWIFEVWILSLKFEVLNLNISMTLKVFFRI